MTIIFRAPPRTTDRSRNSSPSRPSPFRRRKSTPAHVQTSDLVYDEVDIQSACLELVAEIVEEDCRYRVRSPRLTAPTYALQAMTLDVALAVIEPDPKPHTLSAVAFSLIPAFYTFHPRLHPRLLQFFEEGILRELLKLLQKSQGSYQALSGSAQGEDARCNLIMRLISGMIARWRRDRFCPSYCHFHRGRWAWIIRRFFMVICYFRYPRLKHDSTVSEPGCLSHGFCSSAIIIRHLRLRRNRYSFRGSSRIVSCYSDPGHDFCREGG